MNLWLIFLTGLTTGGFTCAAMQGGILASLIANQKKEQTHKGFGVDDWGGVAAFLSTKLLSHIILGMLLGALGGIMQVSLNVRLFFQIFAALFMLATAGNLLELHPLFRYINFAPPRFVYKLLKNNQANSAFFAPSIFGFLTVLIPCGVTQAMAVIAMGSSSAISGGLIMGAFVLGTMPMFALIGTLTAKFSEVWRKDFLRFAAIVLVVMALSSINGILQVLDSPYSVQRLGPRLVKLLPPYELTTTPVAQDRNVKLENNVQKVTLAVANSGYTPKYFRVVAGIPVELTLETKGDVYSCATAFTFKAIDIYDVLKPVDTKVHKFTPTKKGIYTFSCSMGMYSGTMEVI